MSVAYFAGIQASAPVVLGLVSDKDAKENFSCVAKSVCNSFIVQRRFPSCLKNGLFAGEIKYEVR